MKENTLGYFKKFGEIEKLNVESEQDIDIYLYKVIASNIVPEDDRLKKIETPIGFLVTCDMKKDEVGVHCFNLGNKSSFQSDVYEAVNKVNKLIKYGRMYVDEDGDIGWSIVFEQAGTTEDEIKNYLRACVDGIRYLAEEK